MRKSMGAMTIMQYFVGSRLEYVRRVPARAEEHERHARHSDEEEQSDGHAEDALYLIQPALCPRVGDHNRHGDGKSRRGDHVKERIYRVCGVIIPHDLVAEFVRHRYLEEKSDDLDEQVRGGQYDDAGEK